MALVQPTSENKSVAYSPDSLVMPCASSTVINQGTRLKVASNLVTPTTAATDAFVGVADTQNPVASLGDTLTQIKVLLKDNIVYFDAPAADTFNFGATVYAYDNGGNHYSGAVTTSSAGGAVAVGSYVGASGVTGGAGVRVKVKILPTTVI